MRVVFHGTAVLRATGQIVGNAEVEVRNPDGSPAEIWSNRTGTEVGDRQANPFYAEPDGDFFFYAEQGRYSIFCSDGAGNTQLLQDIVMVSEMVIENPMTLPGDIIIAGAGGAVTRLPIGTEGQVLTVVSGVPAWVTPA